MTPIVRESQVGKLLRMLWFVLGFMKPAFVKGGKGGGEAAAAAAREGESFFNKGVRFSVRSWC